MYEYNEVCIMSDPVQTTSDSLRNLVHWAHSHGTICSLLPNLQRLTFSSHDHVLTLESGHHGSSVPVAVWGCGAGHAYHWPLSDHSNGCGRSANTSQGQERLVGGRLSNKVTAKAACDLSYSEEASEGEEFSRRLFDNTGCDSSATDEDGDYEPRPSRKRGPAPDGAVAGKKVKQETVSAEGYDSAANTASAGAALKNLQTNISNTHSQVPHTLLLTTSHSPSRQPEEGEDLGCEGSEDLETEPLGGSSCMTGTTELGEQNELEKLRGLLCAERSSNQQMTEIISSLKQDKELLQHKLTKKAELICDILQDKLRPEKRWPFCSNQLEPGSSHMPSSDDVTAVDSPFDSFEEMELHPLDQHRTLKGKRSRDGENTRVRMKNVVGVIARYMAALQEFRCSVSMKVAFDRVGVDRNTISRTAAIAELSLAAPEVFHALAPWDEKEETLAHYAHRCRQAMDDSIKAKIKTMKAKGELLPIVSK